MRSFVNMYVYRKLMTQMLLYLLSIIFALTPAKSLEPKNIKKEK